MTPRAWSYSSLSAFKNCPKQFFEVKIAKSVVEIKGEATVWGEEVHKHFEDRLRDGVVLPDVLEMHEPFLNYIQSLPGELMVEQKIALNKRLEPCEFFDPATWYRGIIDVKKIHGAHARLWDHKTGKHKNDFGQLKLFALHTFHAHPEVDDVRAEYYWTQSLTTNGETYTRAQIPDLWGSFIPDLRQYAQAFQEDVWQTRPSGLCHGWCPVTDCEHWKPKRKR